MPPRNPVNPRLCVPSLSNDCPFGNNCSLRHDIFECTCGRIMLASARKPHMKGKPHRKALLARQVVEDVQNQDRGNQGGNGGFSQQFSQDGRVVSLLDRALCLFSEQSSDVFSDITRNIHHLHKNNWSANIVRKGWIMPPTMLMLPSTLGASTWKRSMRNLRKPRTTRRVLSSLGELG